MTCNRCKNVGAIIDPDISIGTNGVLIIGESPKGQLSDCLESPTFKRLSLILAEVDILLSECSFTEICKCELRERKDFKEAGITCMPKLIQQIQTLRPNVIITLGVPANELFSSAFGLKPQIGELVEVNSFQYLPLWHTSPINPKGFEKNRQILTSKLLTLRKK